MMFAWRMLPKCAWMLGKVPAFAGSQVMAPRATRAPEERMVQQPCCPVFGVNRSSSGWRYRQRLPC